MPEVRIPTAGQVSAYLAVPPGEGAWSGVVVIHEVGGMGAVKSLMRICSLSFPPRSARACPGLEVPR